jgi:hypothetical protein
MNKVLLYIASAIAVLFVALHSAMYWLLDWGSELSKLSTLNSGVMQIFNIVTIYSFISFAVVTIYIARQKLVSPLAKMAVVFIAGFYVLRIIAGIILLGVTFREAVVWGMCTSAVICYFLALKNTAPVPASET